MTFVLKWTYEHALYVPYESTEKISIFLTLYIRNIIQVVVYHGAKRMPTFIVVAKLIGATGGILSDVYDGCTSINDNGLS